MSIRVALFALDALNSMTWHKARVCVQQLAFASARSKWVARLPGSTGSRARTGSRMRAIRPRRDRKSMSHLAGATCGRAADKLAYLSLTDS